MAQKPNKENQALLNSIRDNCAAMSTEDLILVQVLTERLAMTYEEQADGGDVSENDGLDATGQEWDDEAPADDAADGEWGGDETTGEAEFGEDETFGEGDDAMGDDNFTDEADPFDEPPAAPARRGAPAPARGKPAPAAPARGKPAPAAPPARRPAPAAPAQQARRPAPAPAPQTRRPAPAAPTGRPGLKPRGR